MGAGAGVGATGCGAEGGHKYAPQAALLDARTRVYRCGGALLLVSAGLMVWQNPNEGGWAYCVWEFGGQGWNRTADTGIFSPLLYRLSYLPTARGARQTQRALK